MIANQINLPLISQWKYWGAGFNVSPCKGPVNLEQLLVDTAKGLPDNPRLLIMAVTWLTEHYRIIEIDQLIKLARDLRGRDSARLGVLLETAQEFIGQNVFKEVLDVCQTWEFPEPLFNVNKGRSGLERLARQWASSISRKWGLWADPIEELKHDAIRPACWIAQHNPSFMLRNLLKGDVRCKVMIALAEEGLQDATETDLTRRAGCTRRAMHLALENLEDSGLIMRKRQGRNYAISLCSGYKD